MSSEITLLPTYLLPIVVGIGTASYGIIKEKHYVAPLSILVTVFNIATNWAFTPIYSLGFVVTTGFFILGLLVIIYDVHKNYKKQWVAFLLGSKTIGAVTLYLGFVTNNWIMAPFTPLFLYISPQSQNAVNLEIYVHIMTFVIFIGIIHIIGLGASFKSKRR